MLVFSAAFAPLLAPHDPTDLNVKLRKTTPVTTTEFLLGTDMLGRDMLSRLIYGARTSVFISLVALGTGAIIGTAAEPFQGGQGTIWVRVHLQGGDGHHGELRELQAENQLLEAEIQALAERMARLLERAPRRRPGKD